MKVCRLPAVVDAMQNIALRRSLQPMGTRTAALEVLTSWFCRIAERHWMLTIPLWNELVGAPNNAENPGGRSKRQYLQRVNGHGHLTLKAVNRLKAKFGECPEDLTLLPLAPVLDPGAHGLLKSTLAWCPICWREDRELSEARYVRMLWVLKPVSVCCKHNIQLSTLCPRCGKAQDVLPRIPRQYMCGYCGVDLADSVDRRRLRSVGAHRKEVWIASALGALIARTCAAGVIIPADAFQKALHSLAQQHFNSSLENLADACGFSRRMIRQWATGITKPYLGALLEFAHRVQFPPDSLLLDGVGLTDPKCWLQGGHPSFVKRFKKLSRDRISEIGNALQAAINGRAAEPSSLKKFALQLGTTFSVIRYHFPNEYRLLQARARVRRMSDIRRARIKRIRKAEDAARALASRGIYPSHRALKARCKIDPSSLRRLEVNNALAQIRRDFVVDAPAANNRCRQRHTTNR